jgi:endonuclease/exonuclease/phosphatase family metal-dependent hydrolase
MPFRVVTLNLEQDHKRWAARRPLIEQELARLKPDIVALNEVSLPLQSAQLLRKALSATTGVGYGLVQQTRVNTLSTLEACIDYIWASAGIEIGGSGVCFNQPAPTDATLWPSDHAGVWADLAIGAGSATP